MDDMCISAATIEEVIADGQSRLNEYQLQVLAFLQEWFSDCATLRVQTSGSTGLPKQMEVEKDRMMASAMATCDFLRLTSSCQALLCLPMQYIAGKMMVVRALVAGFRLLTVPPCGHPLAGLEEKPDFAAMVPLQVYNSLQVNEEAEKLRSLPVLIIGGGAIDVSLEQTLKCFPNQVWSTYGMTETLSHIALRRLNGGADSSWYVPMKGVKVSLYEGALRIYAPAVYPGVLQTNDLAEMNDRGEFRILGRRDNVINSGGIKIQIEEVEDALRPCMPVPFLVTSVPHPVLGEEMVVLVKDDGSFNIVDLIERQCQSALPVYWRPKRVLFVEELPFTETGKPQRARARELALNKAGHLKYRKE
ncbi:O-succinylbenzoic acid--CoA ligase family protein [gut metagenome]|uniref:O-succinylbenzoic acid--CoA ligase family protein n=1 Tax=gut metagenome TaxID=749906 RepID=J9CAB7_9ZZZZ